MKQQFVNVKVVVVLVVVVVSNCRHFRRRSGSGSDRRLRERLQLARDVIWRVEGRVEVEERTSTGRQVYNDTITWV